MFIAKLLIFLGLGIFVFGLPKFGLAESSPIEKIGLPIPVSELLNTLEKIKIHVNEPSFTKNTVYSEAGDQTGFSRDRLISDLKTWWERSKNWLESKAGINLRGVLRAFANFFVWIFEFIIRLIKDGVSMI
ncbi:hypothetical protein HY967_02840 [Candidatus Jorgensenbacteria bacterium]|nr:hypothetical protein [Candidatus Jorgensenbacteria bacterium]